MVMQRQGAIVALMLVAGATGCSSFLSTGLRNVVELPIQSADEVRLDMTNRHRAKEAWEEVEKVFPDQCWSKDYVRGYKDGYADYLTYGGNGEPPATPPFIYRLRPYQTPDGIRAIEDWYSGFRHGSAMARASGYRETIVIPLSSPPINAVERISVLGGDNAAVPQSTPEIETLPPPTRTPVENEPPQ
jgi:hypothetical protein